MLFFGDISFNLSIKKADPRSMAQAIIEHYWTESIDFKRKVSAIAVANLVASCPESTENLFLQASTPCYEYVTHPGFSNTVTTLVRNDPVALTNSSGQIPAAMAAIWVAYCLNQRAETLVFKLQHKVRHLAQQ